MKSISLVIVMLSFFLLVHGQKKVLNYSIYDHWPKIENPQISNDGKYVSYWIRRSRLPNKLVFQSCDGSWKATINRAKNGSITDDNMHGVFLLPGDSLGILTLGTTQPNYISNTASYKISEAGRWIAYQLNTAEKELVLYNLETGEKKQFPSVIDYSFSHNGSVLLFQQEIRMDTSKKIQLVWLDLIHQKQLPIWKGTGSILNITFDNSSTQLAFITRKPELEKDHYFLWYYQYPKDSAVVKVDECVLDSEQILLLTNGFLNFSDEGSKVFFTVRNDIKTIATSTNSTMAKLDIWSYTDDFLQSEQLNKTDFERVYVAVYDLRNGQVICLNSMEDEIKPFGDGHNSDWLLFCTKPNVGEMSWRETERPSWYLVSTQNGTRIEVKKYLYGYNDAATISPCGRFVIYYDRIKSAYFSFDIRSRVTRNISKKIPVKLYDEDYDEPAPPPSYGIAGWLEDDSALFINDKFDIWQVDPKGEKAPITITNNFGRAHNLVFRFTNFNNAGDIPLAYSNRQFLLAAFNLKNKQNGFYQISLLQKGDPEKLVMDDCIFYLPQISISSGITVPTKPLKAKSANIFLVQRCSVKEPPNLMITQDFKSFKKLTDLQPQNDYNWMSAELVHWKIEEGSFGTGILYKPQNFNPQERYPIIFYFYERLSDGLNKFIYPELSDGVLDIPYYVSNGYLVFIPDIRYKIGAPGKSIYKTIISAANFLSKKPWVNAQKMGIQGHSFGGYEVNYIVSRTSRFAAACSAAGPSDFVSLYGSIRNDFGSSAQSLFESGQNRINATLWERPDLYIKYSPIFQVNRVTTPLLMMHNRKDGAVPWTQGLELFTALRRLGKRAWMLQYDEEGHQLYKVDDPLDFSIRMSQFFDHYLKDSACPRWMFYGIPAKDKGVDDGLQLVYEKDKNGEWLTPKEGGLLTDKEKKKQEALNKSKPVTVTIE